MSVQLAEGTEQTSRDTPLISLLLAYSAMIPVAAGAVAVWVAPPVWTSLIIRIDSFWCGALLCFFAGVRRGLSFRQSGGPALAQLGGMLWLFGLGIATILSPWRTVSLALPLIGFSSMFWLDAEATRRHEAPLYFAKLRAVQLWIPVISLAVMLGGTIL
jgi:uncharacterized membrane protein YoaK (UPF0700 family)